MSLEGEGQDCLLYQLFDYRYITDDMELGKQAKSASFSPNFYSPEAKSINSLATSQHKSGSHFLASVPSS